MFLFRSEEERKMDRLKELSFDNTSEFTFKGKSFFSKVLDIYDGDTITITVKIDGEYHRMNCRLSRIDTPELRSSDEDEKKAGLLAKRHLFFLLTKQKIESDVKREDLRKRLAEINAIVKINCLEFDKYGRLLVEIWVDSMNINDKMIEDGFAGSYDGGTKGEWRTYFKHSL